MTQAEMIHAARARLGLSTPKLARLTGISQRYIMQLDHGTCAPLTNPEKIIALSQALDLDPWDVLGAALTEYTDAKRADLAAALKET